MKKRISKKQMLKDMLESKPEPVQSVPLERVPAPTFELWKKITFKDKSSKTHDAYVYHVERELYYVSQNKGFDTFCHAQTWIINKNQIVN